MVLRRSPGCSAPFLRGNRLAKAGQLALEREDVRLLERIRSMESWKRC